MRSTPAIISTLFMALTLLACEKEQAQETETQEVFVTIASEHPYRPQQGFNARIESRSDVDITAQVTGKLLAIHFKEGDQVSMGAPLFDIDPAPYKAALSRANAELSKAKANQKAALKNFERGKKLVTDGFISGSEYDTLEARMLESAAASESAQAALESAQVDLEYTNILAPQDGRVGRAKPAIGDVVSPQYGVLTTLVGQEDMEVVFQLPEKLLLAATNRNSKIKVTDIVVAVKMSDGTEYPHTGTIHYFSNRVDGTTGTLEARASIPNPDDILRPGFYVRAVLRLKEPLMGLMIPQAAVQVDQRGTYVLAVDEHESVTRINLVTGERFAEKVLVNSGLEVGTRVIVRGIQKTRPGDTVVALDYQPATEESQRPESKNGSAEL
jgi:membrane fusion protein (multidrug efflux system)